MKKNKLLIILGIVLLLVVGVILFFVLKPEKQINVNADALKFKEEYEKLNDTYAYGDVKYSNLNIDEANPFVYTSAEKIVETLENGTGIIYLGYSKCPWCRNAVNVLQYLNVDEILYLDMYDQRDAYEVENGKLKKTKDGTDEYYKMLDLLSGVLLDYEIEKDGVNYNVGEKRIYVPLVVGVKDGEIVASHTDVVDLDAGQSPFDLLTNEQQEELKEIYDEIKSKVYDDACDLNSEHGC